MEASSTEPASAGSCVAMKKVETKEVAELLFAIEAALPFVDAYVREVVKTEYCSSNGGPVALKEILKEYDWDNQRWQWVWA